MSDVNTSTNPGTTAPSNFNPYENAILNNCTALRDANENGTACYLGGTERDGKLVIKAEKPITNAINGNEIKGTNQLILQNAFKAAGLKDREVVVYEQAEKNGILIKKNSPYVNITLPTTFNKETNSLNPNLIKEFPKSSCFVLDKDGKPMSPASTFALAKENSERFSKVNKNRAFAHKEEITPEQRDKLLEKNAYEHKRALDYLAVTGGNIEEYRQKFLFLPPIEELEGITEDSYNARKEIIEKEKEMLAQLEAKYPTPQTLEQQKNRAYSDEKRLAEYKKEHTTETPVIDATNTHDPVDYVGKYMAACKLEAEFVTDKESQREVQSRISQNLQKSFDENNYVSAFTFGAECEERAKAVISDFRKQSHEQQRGVAVERPIAQERPEQTVDAISF